MPKAISASRLLIFIIALSVTLRVIEAFMLGNQVEILPSIYDQLSYNDLAMRLLNGHGFSFGINWWPATRAGEPTAHWSYLYTLYLSGVYAIFGPNPLVARLIQATLGGILMPLFAYRLAFQIFPGRTQEQAGAMVLPAGRKARFARLNNLSRFWIGEKAVIPLLAATWVACYGYFIYFAGALMTETFYITAILWTLDSALRISRKTDQRRILSWIELGLAIGLTAMLRQVFLPFVPGLFLWLWWSFYRSARQPSSPIPGGEPGRRSKAAALRYSFGQILRGGLMAGLVLVVLIAPITYFNYQQFGSFVLLNTNAGYAFFWSNHPIYGDDYQPILGEGMPEYRELLPKEVLWMDEAALDRELMRRGIEFVREDPLRYLRLSLDRIPAYFNFLPSASSGLISNLTRVLSYGIALPFIIAGIVLWAIDLRKRHPDGSQAAQFWSIPARLEPGILFLGFAVVYTLIHVLSWAGIRYRLPVDAVTLVFAARSLYSLGLGFLFKRNNQQITGP